MLKRLKMCWLLLTCKGYYLATTTHRNTIIGTVTSIKLYRRGLNISEMTDISQATVNMLEQDVCKIENDEADKGVEIVKDILSGKQ